MSIIDNGHDQPRKEPMSAEVQERIGRRVYSPEYKRRIVAEVNAHRVEASA